MLIPVCERHRALPDGADMSAWPACFVSPPLSRRRGGPAGFSASSERATGRARPRTSPLFKQRERTGCCQLVFSSLIYEGDWTSACNPGFSTPVEAVSPP